MIKIIMGKKGTGKTKTIIDMANKAVGSEPGHVVVIERGEKLKFDITHKARLINSKEYGVKGYDMVEGFLAGIAATNYDITHVFMDSVYKIAGTEDREEFEKFIETLEKLNKVTNVAYTMTVSDESDNFSDKVKGYLISVE